MAHHKSAKTRINRNERKATTNKNRISRIRTELRKVEEAITAGDKAVANSALQVAQPQLHRGVSKGILHKNTVARKLSRLSARIKALAA